MNAHTFIVSCLKIFLAGIVMQQLSFSFVICHLNFGLISYAWNTCIWSILGSVHSCCCFVYVLSVGVCLSYVCMHMYCLFGLFFKIWCSLQQKYVGNLSVFEYRCLDFLLSKSNDLKACILCVALTCITLWNTIYNT